MNEIKVRMAKDGPFDVNDDIAGIVPMALPSEQEALTIDIKNNEQREPIILWRGRVIDGRCRQKSLVLLGKPIIYKELDDNLLEDDVKVFVKSINTRRNLTPTQKIIIACKESFREDNKKSVGVIAREWGISKKILDNARYIYRRRFEFIDPLFNGKSVEILNKDGEQVNSNKITSIYAYLKKEEESITKNDGEHAWSANSYILTQVGKEWFYAKVREYKIKNNIKLQMDLADLANYKFKAEVL
jgi:hypothetical protein